MRVYACVPQMSLFADVDQKRQQEKERNWNGQDILEEGQVQVREANVS